MVVHEEKNGGDTPSLKDGPTETSMVEVKFLKKYAGKERTPSLLSLTILERWLWGH